jgi:outer membrane biosynthesis protein TonB
MKLFVAIGMILVSAGSVLAQGTQPEPAGNANQGAVGENRKLVILKKRSAPYTSSARANGIKGTLMLKVEFLSTGKIGQIVDAEANSDQMRRFGLVASAMKAAKDIKFKPEIRNGQPVTVIRSVVYSFDLY